MRARLQILFTFLGIFSGFLGIAHASEAPYPLTATYVQKVEAVVRASQKEDSRSALKEYLRDTTQPLADRLDVHLIARHTNLAAEVALLPELSDCSGVESFFLRDGTDPDPTGREAVAKSDYESDTCTKAYLGSLQTLWSDALKNLACAGPEFREKQRRIHATGFLTRMNLLGLLRAKAVGSRKQDLVALGLGNLKSYLDQAVRSAHTLRQDYLSQSERLKKKANSTALKSGTPDFSENLSLQNARFLAEIAENILANLLKISNSLNAQALALSPEPATQGPGFELMGSPVTGVIRARLTEDMTAEVAFFRISNFMRGKLSPMSPTQAESSASFAAFRELFGAEIKAGTSVLANLTMPEFFQDFVNQPLLKSDFDINTANNGELSPNCYSTARKYAFGSEFPHVSVEPSEMRELLNARYEKIEVTSDSELQPGDLLTYWGYQMVPRAVVSFGENGLPTGGSFRPSDTGAEAQFEILHVATYLGSGLTFSKADTLFSSDHRVKTLAEESLLSTIKSRQVWRRQK